MSNKTFTVAGYSVSVKTGVPEIRFTNDIMRIKVLEACGEKEVTLVTLPYAMTKGEIATYFKSINWMSENAGVQEALDELDRKQNTVATPKAPKAPKVAKTAKVAKVAKEVVTDTITEAEFVTINDDTITEAEFVTVDDTDASLIENDVEAYESDIETYSIDNEVDDDYVYGNVSDNYELAPF